MTAYPTWTPAPRPGIIPLHPLGFGTILGRSFTALRQNPRVLLGFALVVQTVATLLVAGAIVGLTFYSLSRLAAVDPGSEDFDTVMAGSIALIGIGTFVLSVLSTVLVVIVQGIVVAEVAHAVVAEKRTLGQLWRQIKPVAGRLVGYALLLSLVVTVVAGVAIGLLVLLAQAALPAVIVLSVLLFLAAIPLVLWLTVKLLLVPATIIMEHATIRAAVVRSWVLTRGRFWSSLGVIVIISLSFGFIGQVVSIPFTFATVAVTSVFTPTGDPDVQALIALVLGSLATQAVVVLIQSMALVVTATATALIYVDCRMRHEGLDLDLLAYVDERDAGGTDLPDPYRRHIGRRIGPRPPGYGYGPGAPVPYPAAPGYVPMPPYGPGAGSAPYAPAPGSPPSGPSVAGPAPDPRPQTPPAGPPAAPPPTQWTPPGGHP